MPEIQVDYGNGSMACICYKMSSGRQSHPIEWITLAAFPRTEAGFHAALIHEADHIRSSYATRIVKGRDDDCRKVWMVQRCKAWKCCEKENA